MRMPGGPDATKSKPGSHTFPDFASLHPGYDFCSAPERPVLRFAHNLWPGYFPITLARELGYYARENVAVELIYTEDTEPRIADFIAGKYDGMALPIGSLIVASGHHPDPRVVYALEPISRQC